MANYAAGTQLPIMVRKPKVVWPGLDKMNMYQKQIAGDGKCNSPHNPIPTYHLTFS